MEVAGSLRDLSRGSGHGVTRLLLEKREIKLITGPVATALDIPYR